jgi:hypothetical protein
MPRSRSPTRRPPTARTQFSLVVLRRLLESPQGPTRPHPGSVWVFFVLLLVTKLVPEVEEDGLLQFTKFAAVGTAASVLSTILARRYYEPYFDLAVASFVCL